MQQRVTWINCLIIGISVLLVLQLCSCKGQDSNIGPLDVTVIYKNETSKGLKYFQSTETQNFLVFEIEPLGEKVMEIAWEFDTNEGLNPGTCCEGVFESFQGRNNGVLVEFDNSRCLMFESGNGPTTQNISGYEATLLSSNKVQYTYTFTDEHYLEAIECE